MLEWVFLQGAPFFEQEVLGAAMRDVEGGDLRRRVRVDLNRRLGYYPTRAAAQGVVLLVAYGWFVVPQGTVGFMTEVLAGQAK